jgi:hypothetical protein
MRIWHDRSPCHAPCGGADQAKSHHLAALSVEITSNTEISFSTRKPDKMRALSVTHTMEP